MIPKLTSFLAEKPLYYTKIDHRRIQKAYRIFAPHWRRPRRIVHLVGTNGKGSTGRMIAHLAYKSFLRLASEGESRRDQAIYDALRCDTSHIRPLVGHYTSPHILRFNERIWIDGDDADDATLEAAHRKLYAILGQKMSEALSYFEYTTLLAFVVFEGCELAVLEAGLGGEFDATNVCDKELSVITPIGWDHQDFLGDSIEAIAQTKLRSIGSQALLAPQPYAQTYREAVKIAQEKGATLYIDTRDERWKEAFKDTIG